MTRLNQGEILAVLAATNALLLGLRCAHPALALGVASVINLLLSEALGRALFTSTLLSSAYTGWAWAPRLVRAALVDPLLTAAAFIAGTAVPKGAADDAMAAASGDGSGSGVTAAGEKGGLLGAVRRVSFPSQAQAGPAAPPALVKAPTTLPPIGECVRACLGNGWDGVRTTRFDAHTHSSPTPPHTRA